MGKWRPVALGALLALAVLVLAGVWIAQSFLAELGGGRPSEPLAPLARAEEPGAADETGLEDAGSSRDARGVRTQVGEVAADARADSAAKSEALRAGRLDFQVVDDTSGAPLADLAWVAYCEQRDDELLGHGRTDAEGRASLAELPENTIVITTERRPPHRGGWHAVWLSRGEHERAVVRVPSGGAVRGRVVDERGAPRAGIEITLPVGPSGWLRNKRRDAAQLDLERGRFGPGPREVVAVTGADGGFFLEHVGSLPRNVWVVDERPRPEEWKAVPLRLRSPGLGDEQAQNADTHVADGETVDLGELTLMREVRYAGTLWTSEGRPAVGVLVNASRREVPEGPEGDGVRAGDWGALSASDSVTDAAGRFTWLEPGYASSEFLHQREKRVRVLCSNGAIQWFVVPRLAPGEAALDLEWTLDRGAFLVLHATTPKGEPADPIEPEGLETFYAPSRGAGSLFDAPSRGGNVEFLVEELRVGIRFLQPGHRGDLRFALEGLESLAERVVVRYAGYRPAEVFLGGTLDGELVLPVELEPLPRLELEFEVTGIPEGDPRELFLGLNVCRVEATALSSARELSQRCCGLGGRLVNGGWSPPSESVETLSLPVFTDAPYWVAVGHAPDGDGGRRSRVEPLLFGPFTPGVRGRIALPFEHLVMPVGVTPVSGDPEPPPIFAPGEELEEERGPEPRPVRAMLVDAATGDALGSGARLWFHDLDADADTSSWSTPRGNMKPDGLRARVEPGATYRMRAECLGYEPLDCGEVRVEVGEGDLDVGTFRLTPLPTWRLAFVNPEDGEPLFGRLELFRGPDAQAAGGLMELDSNGTGPEPEHDAEGWTVHGRGGDSLWARLRSTREADTEWELPQRRDADTSWFLPLGRVHAGDEVEVRLPPPRAVRLELVGIPPEEERARPILRLTPLDQHGLTACRHGANEAHDMWTCALRLGQGDYDASTDRVVTRTTVGAGRYELEGLSVLHPIPRTTLVVEPGEGEQVVVLTVK